MKHLKKILAVALVCVMSLTLLVGCGKTSADYQKELSTKLTNAKIGFTVDDELNKSTEAVTKAFGAEVQNALSGKNYDTDAIMKKLDEVAKQNGISADTQCLASVLVGGQVVANIGYGEASTSKAQPVDFFVSELKNYKNYNETGKLTKAGIASTTIHVMPFIDAEIVLVILK